MIEIIFAIVVLAILFFQNPFNLIGPYVHIISNGLIVYISIFYKGLFFYFLAKLILEDVKKSLYVLLNPFLLIDILTFPFVSTAILSQIYNPKNKIEEILLIILNPLYLMRKINTKEKIISYILILVSGILFYLNYNVILEILKKPFVNLLVIYSFSFAIFVFVYYFVDKNNKLLMFLTLSLLSLYFKNFYLFYMFLFPTIYYIKEKIPMILLLLLIYQQSFIFFQKIESLNYALKDIYDFNNEFHYCDKIYTNIYNFNYGKGECLLILLNPYYQIADENFFKYIMGKRLIYFSKTQFSYYNKFGIDLYLFKG